MPNQKFSQAIIYSQKLLSQYQRTVFEIQEKLKNKNYSPNIIKQVIKYLENKDYLNDKNYAISFLEFELKNRPCGKFLCYKKLVKKGIPKNLASQILDENYPEEKELELAKILAQKKCRDIALQCLSVDKIMRKTKSYLSNKGFSESTIIELFTDLGYLN